MQRKNISIGASPLTYEQIQLITPRIRERMEGWTVHYPYKGTYITIPDQWNSKLYPFQYAEIYKTNKSEDNPGEEESEIQLYLGLGWPSCDFEVIIALRIAGTDVLKPDGKVTAEIIKVGGADMLVKYRNKVVTDFKQYGLWGRFFEMEKALVTVEIP